MHLNIEREAHGGGDVSWLGSRHGVDVAQTYTLDKTTFSGVEDGVVPAGTPVEFDAASGKVKPFATTLTGFTLNDVSVAKGDAVVAVLERGRIRVNRLPVEFTPPADSLFVFTDVTVDEEEVSTP